MTDNDVNMRFQKELDRAKGRKASVKPDVETRIADRTWRGQQSWNRERIVEVGGSRLRYTVKVDSYAFQSYARVEKWNGDSWHVLHAIPGEQISTRNRISYVTSNVHADAFDDDITELRRVAHAVMGVK